MTIVNSCTASSWIGRENVKRLTLTTVYLESPFCLPDFNSPFRSNALPPQGFSPIFGRGASRGFGRVALAYRGDTTRKCRLSIRFQHFPVPNLVTKISVLCRQAIPLTPAASQSSAASHQTSAVPDDSLLAATCAPSNPDPREFIGHWIGSLPKLREYEEVPGVSTGDHGMRLSTLVTHAHIRFSEKPTKWRQHWVPVRPPRRSFPPRAACPNSGMVTGTLTADVNPAVILSR
jgi:hypothetical protein